MKPSSFLSLALIVVGTTLVLAQQASPPNAYDWPSLQGRIERAREVVLLSVDALDPELSEVLLRLGHEGVRIYLLTNESGPVLQTLERSGARVLGRYTGPLIIVDDSVFAYLDEYGTFVEAPSPGLARMYLEKFGIDVEGGRP